MLKQLIFYIDSYIVLTPFNTLIINIILRCDLQLLCTYMFF